MTKLSDLGYFDTINHKFVITDFDRSWEKTQKGTFIHTISEKHKGCYIWAMKVVKGVQN